MVLYQTSVPERPSGRGCPGGQEVFAGGVQTLRGGTGWSGRNTNAVAGSGLAALPRPASASTDRP
jgi:hypothetical protein